MTNKEVAEFRRKIKWCQTQALKMMKSQELILKIWEKYIKERDKNEKANT